MTHDEQAELFIGILKRRQGKIQHTEQVYEAILKWLQLPIIITEGRRQAIVEVFCEKTGNSPAELQALLTQSQTEKLRDVVQNAPENSVHDIINLRMMKAGREEKELDALIPKSGYFRQYIEFTRNSEAPMSYHFYCAMAGIAATINRRIYLDMGSFKLYPPFGVFLLGDSGIKKTSSADIIIGILRELGCVPIYAEKLTPEALIDGMKGGNATGFVYAPEMTVLISKQKYMESIIPLLTRFMDSPDVWSSGTIMRGKAELTDVAITCLMCSTIDWFTKNTPEALFGGGFIARNVMVLQDISPRIVARPQPEDKLLRQKIMISLANIHSMTGEASLHPKTLKAYEEWYVDNKLNRMADNDLFETYYARKPSHLLRMALCLHVGTHQDLQICAECFNTAFKILEWTEQRFTLLNDKMFKSSYGADQDLVMKAIEQSGGEIQHSTLLRKLSYKIPTTAVKVILANLKEMNYIEEYHTAVAHLYRIRKGVIS